jgi:tetratricopeptide (TPR) repeat protein
MKKFVLIFILFTFSNLLFSQAYIGNKKIIGYVFDNDKTPIEKAIINFYNLKIKDGFKIETDKRGKFESDTIVKGLWRIRIYKEGFIPTELFIYTKKENTFLKNIILKKLKDEPEKSIAEKLDKAAKFFIDGKYKKSIKIYEKLIKENQYSIYINSLLGENYYYNKKYEKAAYYFSEALKEIKNNDLSSKIADCFIKKGEEKNSLKFINKLKIENIKNPLILSDIGIFFYKRGEFKKANKFLVKGIKLYPENSEAHYYLGLSYTSINKPDKAIKHLKKFIELEPDSPDVVVADSIINTFKDLREKQ